MNPPAYLLPATIDAILQIRVGENYSLSGVFKANMLKTGSSRVK